LLSAFDQRPGGAERRFGLEIGAERAELRGNVSQRFFCFVHLTRRSLRNPVEFGATRFDLRKSLASGGYLLLQLAVLLRNCLIIRLGWRPAQRQVLLDL
jgi:hypothetical protein